MHTDLTCDYTRTLTNGDEVQVERFESSDGRWTLLEVDGEPPTKRRLKKYAGQTDQRAERQHPAAVDFANLGEPGSYALVEQDAQHAVYRFKPLAEDEDDEKIVHALVGRLTIDTESPRVVAFEVTNLETFSPAAVVTIHDMEQRVEFAPLAPGGVVVSRRMETRMEGRAFGLKKISDHRLISFDDFDCR